MPAYDRYHFAVVRALEREDWVVVARPPWFTIGDRTVHPDIVARNEEMTTIVVEVKTFERESQVDALADALGKVLLYRAVLDVRQLDIPLILAVPVLAAEGILSEPLGQLVLHHYHIPLLVVDVDNERIVEWNP